MRRFRRSLQAIGLFSVLVIGIPSILLWANSAGATPDCVFELSSRFPGCLISHQKELAGALIGAWGTVLAGWLAWIGVQGQLAAGKKEDIRKRINLLGDEQVAFDRFVEIALKLCVLVDRWDNDAGLHSDPSQFFLGTIKSAAEKVPLYFSDLKKPPTLGVGDDAYYLAYHRALHDAFLGAHEFRNIASAIDVSIYSKQAAGYSALHHDFSRRSELNAAYENFVQANRAANEKRGEIIKRLNQDLSNLL